MKMKEIRAMSKDETLQALASIYRQEAVTRMKMSMDGKKDTTALSKLKKTIARLLTVLNESKQSEVA